MATATNSPAMYSVDGASDVPKDGTLLIDAPYILAYRNGLVAFAIATSTHDVTAYYASYDEELSTTTKHVGHWPNVVGRNSGLILAFRIAHPGRHTLDFLSSTHLRLRVPLPRDEEEKAKVPLTYALYVFVQDLVAQGRPEVMDWGVFTSEFKTEYEKARLRDGGGYTVYHLVTSRSAWLAEKTRVPRWA